MKNWKRYVGGAALTALSVGLQHQVVFAQETTGDIRGVVTAPDGTVQAGATVTVTHGPTGASRTSQTGADGGFAASGLRVGGPYSITVAAPGAEPQTVQDIYVTLGDTYRLNFDLAAFTTSDIVVTGESLGGRDQKEGLGSAYGEQDIANLPSISGDPKDIARLNPFVSLEPSQSDALIVAGTNNRYNSFTVDSVRQNDDFGLNSNGYPTQRSPVSLDALAAIEVNVAPFSVVYNEFVGANLNAVTKSGTNKFTGGAFYAFNNDNLRSSKQILTSRPSNNTVINRTKTKLTAPFEEKTYGAYLGGPVVPDMLFFFLNGEQFEGLKPVQSGPAGSGRAITVGDVSAANVTSIESSLASRYGYDFEQANSINTGSSLTDEDKKYLVKLDWNLGDNHRLVAQYQYNDGVRPVEGIRSSTTNLSLFGNYYNITDLQKIYTAQLFSNWTDNFSTEVTYSKKKVERGQISLGGVSASGYGAGDDPNMFGMYTITTAPSVTVTAGPDISRHANELTNDTETMALKGTYYWGDHKFLAGIERKKFDAYNLFVSRSEGDFVFNSIADLQNGTGQRVRYQSAVLDVNQDGVINKFDGAIDFGYDVWSVYAEDAWDLTPDLSILAGLRYERYESDDKPIANPFFLSRYGFTNSGNLDGLDSILPRFSFDWRPTDYLNVSGGAGLFSGGGPNVWISNNYGNTGMQLALVDCQRGQSTSTCSQATAESFLNNVNGFNIPNSIETLLTTAATPRVNSVNALAADFEPISSWKFNLGADFDMGAWGWDGWGLHADLLLTDVNKGLRYYDLRAGTTPIGFAPDGRPIYRNAAQRAAFIGATGADTGADLVLANTDEGGSTAFALSMDKNFANGLSFFGSYTRTNADEVQANTSSVASSNFGQYATYDQNEDRAFTANYEIRDSFKVSLSYEKAFFGDNKTRISLFGERRSGLPFSYTFNALRYSSAALSSRQNDTTAMVNTFGDTGFTDRQLFYVPDFAGDANTIDQLVGIVRFESTVNSSGVTTQTAQQAHDLLRSYVLGSADLIGWQGMITPRNAFNSQWVTKVDMRLSQEIPAFFPTGAKGQFFFDIENLLNLINPNWGQVEQIEFPSYAPLVDVRIDPATNQYVYSNFRAAQPFTSNSDAPNRSLWMIKMGFKYNF